MKSIMTAIALLMATVPCLGATSLTGVDAKIWNGLSRTNWISQGNGERIIYAFIDPNCPYSRDLFKRVQQSINPTTVQIRWVPVGVLQKVTADSRYKAAAAMKGGSKTLDIVMGGNAPDAKPSSLELSQVDGSADFLNKEIEKYVPAGVPKVIYVKDDGKEIRVFTGVPPNSELAKLFR